jgi:hypothetical protein
MATKKSDFTKILALILTLLTLSIGAVLYISEAHAEIKDWTLGQEFVKEKVIKDNYVPKHEFIEVRTELKESRSQNEKEHKEIIRKLDKLFKLRR